MPATLKSRLPGIAAELQPRVSKAVKEGAEKIALAAQQKAPTRTGELVNRIHVERVGPAEYAVVGGDSEAFYGHMVEFGTTHSAAQPFLTPAFEENQHEVAADVQSVLRSL